MTKSEISKQFTNLRKHNCLVFNFQSNRYMPYGSLGFVDILIIYKYRLWLIEIKTKTDRIKPKQQELIEYMNKYPSEHLQHRIATDETTHKIINEILTK